jgi:hypothetical protein
MIALNSCSSASEYLFFSAMIGDVLFAKYTIIS